MDDNQTFFLDVANAAVSRWRQLDLDRLDNELNTHVWPLSSSRPENLVTSGPGYTWPIAS